MNIVLIGYRGTGKSTVAAILGKTLGMTVLNMDNMITERAGMSVPEIVKVSGWEAFRDIESEIAAEMTSRDNCIIDAGGGAILRNENVKNLKKNSKVILLTASVATIVKRIQSNDDRPSLTGDRSFTMEVSQVLEERRQKYCAAADLTVDTDNLTPRDVAEKALCLLRENGAIREQA